MLYWCVMRPANRRFFSCIYLRIFIVSYLATFLGTNIAFLCWCAVKQSVGQLIRLLIGFKTHFGSYINAICCSMFHWWYTVIYLLLQSLINGTIVDVWKLFKWCGNVRYWVIKLIDCSRYLGVFFNSGSTLKCYFDNSKSCFFRAFNALYSKVADVASGEIASSIIRAIK